VVNKKSRASSMLDVTDDIQFYCSYFVLHFSNWW